MAVWVVRGGRYGEREEEALENGRLTIGFGLTDDLSDALTRDDVIQRILPSHQNATPNQITSWAGQIWAFKGRIQVGDLIVMPNKGKPTISVGRMSGEYTYCPELSLSELSHGRAVEWINKEVNRDSLEQDLKRSLSGDATVFQPRASDAESRLRSIAEGNPLEPARDSQVDVLSNSNEEVELPDNLEEDANYRIREYIGKKYHGHEFTRLVAAVLQAQGYAVEVAPPGPDGGVDIVAGSGPMGFDPPRICVQVKSGIQTANVGVLRQLEGIIRNFGADYGLLVSWGGFTGEARSEARKGSFFNVRLWDSEAFLNALFDNYDRLPAGLKAELPLKQVWILDEPTL